MKSALLVLTSGLLLLSGCEREPVKIELTDRERTLGSQTGIDESVLLLLRAEGVDLKRVRGVDANEDPLPLNGVEVSIPYDRADNAIQRVRSAIPAGHFVFVSGFEPKWVGSTKQLAVVRGMGPYEIMIAMDTNGANYGITTDQVIARLRHWDSLYGLDFREISGDSISAEFVKKPADMLAFARDVYQFCPDVVTQGTRTVEKLALEMDRANTLYLWWD